MQTYQTFILASYKIQADVLEDTGPVVWRCTFLRPFKALRKFLRMLHNHQQGLWTLPWWFHLVPGFFNTVHRCWHPPGEPWSCWLPLCPRESSLSHLCEDQRKHDPEKNDFPRYSQQSLLYCPPPLSSMALLLSSCYTWQFRWIGVPLLQLLASGVAYSNLHSCSMNA